AILPPHSSSLSPAEIFLLTLTYSNKVNPLGVVMHKSSNQASRLALLSIVALAFVLAAARLPYVQSAPSPVKPFVIPSVRVFHGAKLLPAVVVPVENGFIKAVGKTF